MIVRKLDGPIAAAMSDGLARFASANNMTTKNGDVITRLVFEIEPEFVASAFPELGSLSIEQLRDTNYVKPLELAVSFNGVSYSDESFELNDSKLIDLDATYLGNSWGRRYINARRARLAQVDESGNVTKEVIIESEK